MKLKGILAEKRKEREIISKVEVAKTKKELEKLAKPLAKELGITQGEAMTYLKSKKKREMIKSRIDTIRDIAAKIGEAGENITKEMSGDSVNERERRKSKKRGQGKKKTKRKQELFEPLDLEIPEIEMPKFKF